MIYHCKYNILRVTTKLMSTGVFCEMIAWDGKYVAKYFHEGEPMKGMYLNIDSLGQPSEFVEARLYEYKFIDVDVELVPGDCFYVDYPWIADRCVTSYTILDINDDAITYIQSNGEIKKCHPWVCVIIGLQRKMRLQPLDDLIAMCGVADWIKKI